MSRQGRQSLASILTTSRPASPSVSAGGSDLGRSSIIGRSRRFSSLYGSTRRGSAMAVLQQGRVNDFEAATKSQQVLGLRNDEWNSVQDKVMSLFKGKKLAPGELILLNDQIRAAIKSEIGAFITEYYKKNLLKKGMDVMFEEVDDDSGQKLLDSLSNVWNNFFIDILPTLRAVFYPVQTKGLSIQQLSLLGFRDHIVLRVNLKETLSKRELRMPPEIIQLLLHLQNVRESSHPTDEFLLVETMVAKVVCPYLGTRGLYLGEEVPAVPSQQMDTQPSKNYARRHLEKKGGRPGRPSSLTFADPIEVNTYSNRRHSATFCAPRRSPVPPRRRDGHALTLSSLEPLREDELRKHWENNMDTDA